MKLKSRFVAAALTGVVLAVVQTVVYAAPAAPPAGSAEETIQGSLTVCFKPGTTTPKPCDQKGITSVGVSFLEVGQVTWDDSGNACASGMETISVPGMPVTISRAVTLAGKLSNYDPLTQSGDGTGTGYSGGKCAGAQFDSTGATARSTANFHFVISRNGQRMDSIVTSVSVTDEDIGAFSLSGRSFRQ